MLTNEQAKENLKKYGPNELEEGKKKSVFQIFLEQFKDFLVIILIISAVISGFLGDVESAIVIFVVITMNVTIAVWLAELMLLNMHITIENRKNILPDYPWEDCIKPPAQIQFLLKKWILV